MSFVSAVEAGDAGSGATGRRPSDRARRRFLLTSLDLFIVDVARPETTRDFAAAADLSSLFWGRNAYAVIFVAALPVPAARLGDRNGNRTAFPLGLIVFVVGYALCGAAWNVACIRTEPLTSGRFAGRRATKTGNLYAQVVNIRPPVWTCGRPPLNVTL